MSISTELTRITTARNSIRTKMVNLGVCLGTDDITTMATKIDSIINRGAVEVEVKEGETYTIPAGYHNGSGTVAGVAGGGNYTLQEKTATPSKVQQNITPDEGKYGLSAVTVEAIPDQYQDISATTAEAADVKTGKSFVNSLGITTAGTMPVNAAQTVNVAVGGTQSLSAGYYAGVTINGPTLSGTATAADVLEDETFYNTSGEAVTGTMTNNGAVTASVAVGGTYTVPAGYHNGEGTVTGPTLDGNAVAANVLSGTTFYSNSGTKLTGSMTNNGAATFTIDGLTAMSVTITAGYHNGSGTVSLTNDIETALSAI